MLEFDFIASINLLDFFFVYRMNTEQIIKQIIEYSRNVTQSKKTA